VIGKEKTHIGIGVKYIINLKGERGWWEKVCNEMIILGIKYYTMSVWRRKAMECLPACKQEFEAKDCTIYTVFRELLAATVEAHKAGDRERLKQYYEFAAWCMERKEKDLWNAAGVSFYEHLGDQEETLAEMPKWVRRSIYEQVRELLVFRLGNGIERIDLLYKR
jgi:hypothetical protein